MLLRKKILIGYGIALALMLIVLSWAMLNLVHLGQASDAILRENYKSILAAESMIDAIERQDSATLLVLLGYDEKGAVQFHENESLFLQWLNRAKDNITIPGEEKIVHSIETNYSAYLLNFSRLHEMGVSSSQQAGNFYHDTIFPSFKNVRDNAVRLREINQDTMFAASSRARTVARTAIWSTAAVSAAAIGLGLLFSLLLSKRLVRPIRRMMESTRALAEGDYEVQVPDVGSDELGRLAESFNTMARKLGIYHRLDVEQIVAEKHKSDAVLRSIDDGVVVVDAGFRVANINPQAGHILGVDSEAALGKHFLEVVKDERLFELIKQTAESGRPPKIDEGSSILSIGEGESARHYLFGITPVVSKGGEMMGVVLLLRDVTRLKELDRMKSEFVMTASHELKTPLHSLGMSIDLLREGAAEKLDDKQKELLAVAHEEVLRLRSLVGDLLDLSRIESGKVEMDFDQVSPNMLADKAVDICKARAEEKKIALVTNVPDGIPDVRADVNKITWVLTNLITNAIRYADSSITVSARLAGQWVHLSVTDDGEGIPPEYQSRIFEKFVQLKSEKSVGGTGLGLAICREIVRAHKGTIWVDSMPGKGSTFTLTLPKARQNREDEDESQTDIDRG